MSSVFEKKLVIKVEKLRQVSYLYHPLSGRTTKKNGLKWDMLKRRKYDIYFFTFNYM